MKNHAPRLREALPCLLACLWLMAGCGGGGGGGDVTQPDASDGMQGEADSVLDDAAEALEEAGPQCPEPPSLVEPPDPARRKFALSLFHWNIQYVPGGLETTWDGQPLTLCSLLTMPDEKCLGWGNDELEDWIVTQSFEPVLDLYLAHPAWRTTWEIPGYMVDVMAARHPAVLDKLRVGAQRGQIELVSFHWSAQLFLAFPAVDLERSQAINRAVFERECLPLSGVVFNQEGMSGEGKHRFMQEHGFGIDVVHANMLNYMHFKQKFWPYYKSRGVDVVAGPVDIDECAGMDPASGIEVRWSFFDDGEVLATPLNPYFAFMGGGKPVEVERYAGQLEDLEAQGYAISTITDYVAQLKAQGVAQPELPQVFDSTWQPINTRAALRWLGGRGTVGWSSHERDNPIRVANHAAGLALRAAEVLLEVAGEQGALPTGAAERLEQGWRDLALAEVTDATGINPWQAEWLFGDQHNEAARQAAEGLMSDTLAALGWPHCEVDLASGGATRLEALGSPPTPSPAVEPFAIAVDAPTREVTTEWTSAGDGVLTLRVTFGPGGDPSGQEVDLRRVGLAFPRFAEDLVYTPALAEDEVVTRPLAGFTLQEPEVIVPAANGLVGLGDGWWVVRDNSTLKVAARLPTDGTATVEFLDQTADPLGHQTWMFHVLQGSQEQALALADRVNLKPVLYR
jgi:hypothetical protein